MPASHGRCSLAECHTQVLRGHTQCVAGVDWMPDGSLLSCSHDHSVRRGYSSDLHWQLCGAACRKTVCTQGELAGLCRPRAQSAVLSLSCCLQLA